MYDMNKSLIENGKKLEYKIFDRVTVFFGGFPPFSSSSTNTMETYSVIKADL